MSPNPVPTAATRMTLSIAAALAFLAPTPPASADSPVPPPPGVSVEVVTSNACKDARVVVEHTNDHTVITTYPTAFQAVTGGSAPPTAWRATCMLDFKIKGPADHTYALTRTDHSGFAELESGASGEIQSRHYFTGNHPGGTISHKLKGPHSDNWSFTGKIPIDQQIYMPCHENRPLMTSTHLLVDRPNQDPARNALLKISDSSRGTIIHSLSWKKCGT
jgi:Domain of unknown function (DUF4360)